MPVNTAKVDQALATMKKVEEYITAGMDTTVDVVVDFVESDKTESEKIQELKDKMLQYVSMQRELNQFIEAADAIKSEVIEDPEDIDSLLNAKLEEITSNNDDTELEQHDKYRDMMQRIWDAEHPDDDLSTVQDSQPVGDGDIVMTQQEISTKCPYTQKEMVNPMKNKICSHTYDRESVLSMIKAGGRKARCPYGGCNNNKQLVMSDMEDNLELKRYMEKKNRQAAKSKCKRS